MLAGLAVLAGAGSAHAATFHVTQAGSGVAGCPAQDPCSLPAALAGADAAPGFDVVQVVGALGFSGTVDLGGSPIELRGSGRGAGGTVLDGGAGTALLVGTGSSARDLRAEASAVPPVRITEGGRLTAVDVMVRGGGAAAGIQITGGAGSAETLIADAAVTQQTVTGDGNGIAIDGDADRTVLRDVAISGAHDGIVRDDSGPATIVVQRALLVVTGDGLDLRGMADLRLSSSVVRAQAPVGEPTVAYFNGLRLRGSVQADVRHVTLDGSANTGYLEGEPEHRLADGLDVAEGARADVRAVALLGVYTALECVGSSTGAITVRDSYFDPANPESSPGCPVTDLGGNLAQPGPPPLVFADAAGGDLHLLPGTALVDAAGSEAPGPDESPADLDGRLRISDGNGDALAERDIGAFELGAPVFGGPPAEVPRADLPSPALVPPITPITPGVVVAVAAGPKPATQQARVLGLPQTVFVSRRGAARITVSCRARTACSVRLGLRLGTRPGRTKTTRVGAGGRLVVTLALGSRAGVLVARRLAIRGRITAHVTVSGRVTRLSASVTLRPGRAR